jgi:phage shock protein C
MSSTKAPRDHDGMLSGMRRYPGEGWVAGVCAGIADYFGWSVKVIRVLMILALLFSGFFPVGIVYLALWYLMDPADAPASYGAPRTPGSPKAGGPSTGSHADNPTMTAGNAKARFEKLERRLQNIEACVTQDELELRRQFKKLEA